MSSAVGPVAWDEKLVPEKAGFISDEGEATLRMFNTNTKKCIHSTFTINRRTGLYEPCGDYSIDGVAGKCSPITLSFLEPAGAKTGNALPTHNTVDVIKMLDGSTIRASLVDIANPGVFVMASDVGVVGDVPPETMAVDTNLMTRLEHIRQEGARLMGLDPNIQSIPKIVLISKPTDSVPTDEGVNIVCRALSMQQAHKAVPLTLALNLGRCMSNTRNAAGSDSSRRRKQEVCDNSSCKWQTGSWKYYEGRSNRKRAAASYSSGFDERRGVLHRPRMMLRNSSNLRSGIP